MILLDICLYGSLSEYKDESFMILLDISVFFLDSLIQFSTEVVVAVFLAGRVVVGAGLGGSRRVSPTPVRRCQEVSSTPEALAEGEPWERAGAARQDNQYEGPGAGNWRCEMDCLE